ncbi:glutathione S-transferase [Massarina eburnea CBS 473.64]|uniref:Glutathione S-transferase n=1 Tax=Massarina eburnea CBS 473.64 TaxID=1395130 RepID=A0A6A6S2C8_9PLEO|nr:glutathione S-transferase [Massarina eburnea CBS 473.64]
MADNSNLKPIQLWWRPMVPNPAKIIIILEELSLPYTGTYLELEELKQPKYESINPNGRLPSIHDPNTDITLWESGAIINYLIATYDKTNKISYDTFPEKHHLDQWSYFQTSGQGPYFGQAAWFLLYHSEQVESAKERYLGETRRVAGVLDKWLGSKTSGDGNAWLVGDKITYVDLMFVNWNAAVGMFVQMAQRPKEDWDPETQFPHFWKWQSAMVTRPSFLKAVSLQKAEDVHL